MGKGKPWTDEDEFLLIENIDKISKEEILKMFPDRTWKALQHKYKKLGFKFRNKYDPIPKDELFKIIDNTKYMKCKSCRRYLPCKFLYFPRDSSCRIGFRSICKECKGENFVIREFVWTEEEAKIVYDKYESMTNQEMKMKYFPDKSLEQICHKGTDLGLHKSKDTILRSKNDSYTDEWKMNISSTKIKNGSSVGKKNSMYGTSRKGSDNPNWNGGISKIYHHLRRSIKLWKYASMEECDYKCIISGDRFDDIHHVYNFKNIILDTLNNLDFPIKEYINEYSEYDMRLIEKECLRIHMNNIGVCLRADIHRLYHENYGWRNNTPEQFHEFKTKYLNGEFRDKSLTS